MAVAPTDDTLTIVDKPELPPGYCIATMREEDKKGFIDTLLTPPIIDPRIYLSVSYVEDVARRLGMDYVESASDDRVAELEARLAEAEAQLAAIDVIESAGYTTRKRPGRKPSAKKTTKTKANA